MTLGVAFDFLHAFTARLQLINALQLVAAVCFPLLIWWSVRVLSIPRVSTGRIHSIPNTDCLFQQDITGVIKLDTSKLYRDVDGQAARRKRERKQRYLLSLGKFII
jgi:hypothetical protein